ncbi:MAG: four helix bundle protein [Bacteroidota bacterium]|nr:four helix bundle protein [Bacteroidota bacterium]
MENSKSFKTLEAWKKARAFRKEISALTKTFPKHEQFKLVDQILRSSRSVSANIAEGYGRYHYLENMRFCRIARGSLTETLDHLIVAFDEEYISEEKLLQMEKMHDHCLHLINGYVLFLKNKKKDEKSRPK